MYLKVVATQFALLLYLIHNAGFKSFNCNIYFHLHDMNYHLGLFGQFCTFLTQMILINMVFTANKL